MFVPCFRTLYGTELLQSGSAIDLTMPVLNVRLEASTVRASDAIDAFEEMKPSSELIA